jgi:hypothetical protein
LEVHCDFAMSLARACAHFGIDNVSWFRLSTAEISHSRNSLLKMFRESDASIACWIDSDIAFGLDDLRCIVEPVAAGELDVVHACYPHRLPGFPRPTGLDFVREDLDAARGYVGPIRIVANRQYLRAARVAGGVSAWGRRAIEKACAICPAPKRTTIGNLVTSEVEFRWLFGARADENESIAEDHAACDVARRAGVEFWVSLEAMPRHVDRSTVFHGRPGWIEAHARAQAVAIAKEGAR